MTTINHELKIPLCYHGKRLDQVLPMLLPDYSRSCFKNWIEAGYVFMNGKTCRPRDILKGEEQIVIQAIVQDQVFLKPEDLKLDVVFEDKDVLVVNKPVGMIVHPGAGNFSHTLVNALLHHCPKLKNLPRAGLIHRLDKDTSGLLVVAKNLKAHTALATALMQREVHREYEAIVYGTFTGGGTVDAPIGRDPHHRTRMAIVEDGREAITHYRVIEKFAHITHLWVKLETGRTHQIRVHLSSIHHPLVGDPVYGGRLQISPGTSEKLSKALRSFKRQALHAKTLSFQHPATHEVLSFTAKLPKDMSQLLKVLKEEKLNPAKAQK